MNVVNQRDDLLPSPVLGMMLFIGTEVMFFSGLISAFLVIRAGVPFWPPAGQPRLPVEATAFNTLVLLASGVAIYLAGKAQARAAGPPGMASARKLVGLAAVLGTFFVLFQGYEWVRLIGYGLSLSSSLYGALFYVIIGAHGMHVVAALGFLLFIRAKLAAPGGAASSADIFTAFRLFWYFVVGVWPVLYGLVYLY